MRIQHNIMSMNAYRNYNNNASALSKNLEKLSSGYKINRAGDDAAGLAISEKMRAQIQGLNAAQKNVKDGISLVKTAEGAMQEIQDMLSRMKYLATQSSNGTYDDDVDRAALQDEVDQLREEINRIADSANFNGTPLLDGSLASEGGSAGVSSIKTSLPTTDIDPVAGKYTAAKVTAAPTADGDTISYTLALDNGKSYTVDFTFQDDGTTAKLVSSNGTEYKATQGGATATEIGDALVAELKSKVGKDFKITNAAGALTFEATTKGTSAPVVTGLSQASNLGGTETTPAALAITEDVKAADAQVAVLSADITEFTGANFDDAVFTINGKQFVWAKEATDTSKLDKSITVVTAAANNTQALGDQLSQATGLKFTYDAAAGGTGKAGFKISAGESVASKGGLQLQIGDTADSYNQLKVSVNDMHTKAMGIDSISIADIDSATSAIDDIKNAINYVSSTRGTLGAIQNRLEHTANNLSVMTENIQDAESTIRDTDVADEMMAYTKNNILIQSAQAMLAQANAVPQGVLQLLQ